MGANFKRLAQNIVLKFSSKDCSNRSSLWVGLAAIYVTLLLGTLIEKYMVAQKTVLREDKKSDCSAINCCSRF